jgi:Lrp/AsnC family leucine-responsive transcriptional regulator
LFFLLTQDFCMTSLDSLDRRLLAAVQQDNRLTTAELGQQVGLSATACQRRLKRLRDEGVIEADIAVVSPRAVGRPVSMLVLVTLERERADIVDRFKASIRATKEVMIGLYVTGDADFVLYVTASDMEDYERFTRRFFYENPDIKGFKTMVVMDRVKAGFALPIEP